MPRILGIDPGSKITGYGIIEVERNKIHHIECGGIHPKLKDPLEKRLLYIHQKIREIIIDFKPDYASVEDIFVAKNAKSSLTLGEVRGVVLLALAELQIPYSTFTPKEVKKAVTGEGGASKEQIQYMVRNLLNLNEIAFEDASDALAAAICCSNILNFQNRLIK